MTIQIYSKPGCGICEAAKDKLRKMGLEYEEHSISYHVEHHEGWREDDSVSVMAAHTEYEGALPLIRVDGNFHDYPGAMRTLKKMRREAVVTA